MKRKKRIALLLSWLWIMVIFTGFVKVEEPKTFAERFIRTYFTVKDHTKINFDAVDFMNDYVTVYAKPIHEMMDETSWKDDLKNRRHVGLLSAATNNSYDIKVKGVKLTKLTKNISGAYDMEYKVTVQKIYSKVNNRVKAPVICTSEGQLTIAKTGDAWKVTRQWFDFQFVLADLKHAVENGKMEPKTGQNQEKETGFLWQVKGGAGTVYLFGSIHIAKPDLYPMGIKTEMAFQQANNLVLELNVLEPINIAQEIYYKGDETIYNHLSTAGAVVLDEYAKQNNLDKAIYSKLKAYTIDSYFTNIVSQKAGYGYGVDMYFAQQAYGEKRLLELEGAKFQLDFLNHLGDEVQEQLLLGDIKSGGANVDGLKEMYDAYVAGDESRLDQIINTTIKNNSPELYEKLLVQRNIGMAEKIDAWIKTQDSYFVVAGAGHFIGNDSVIKLLEKKGYVVERIR